MTRVVIVDDQPIIRQGLKMILGLDTDIKMAGEAANGVELMRLLHQTPCDLILMDVRMPLIDGVEATLRVKNEFSTTKVLILTTFEDDEYIFSALKNGADGYLLKDADPEDIIRAIKTVCGGEMLLHPRITKRVVSALANAIPAKTTNSGEPPKLLLLTTREREVANCIAQGKSNREIGQQLFVTEGTIKNHVTKVLAKLELRTRTELIVYMTKVMGSK